jgi:hypothetical protein
MKLGKEPFGISTPSHPPSTTVIQKAMAIP